MSLNNLFQLLMLIASTAAIIVSACMSRKSILASMKMVREQNQIQMFAEYTKRYQEIIVNMPRSVFEGSDEVNNDVLRYMRLYFNLCSEEYDLWSKGFISPDVWERWLSGIKITMNSPVYKIAWSMEREDYSVNPSFVEFLDSCIQA